MRAVARRVADLELVILAVLLPGLILPNPLSPGIALALPVLWLVRWVGRGTCTRRTSLDGPILFLLLLMALGLGVSPDRAWSLNALYLHLAGVALYSGLVNWIAPAYRGPEPPPVGAPGRRIVGAAGLLVAGGAALALVSPLLVPNWGKIGINGPLLPEAFAILEPRLPDTIQTNTLGTVMAMLICLAAAWLLAVERGQPGARYRPVQASALAIALVVMGIVSVLAWSRGALVALVPALLLVLALTDWRFLGAVPLVTLLGVGLVGWLGPQRVVDQILSSGPAYHGVAATRLEIWDRAWRLLVDVPYTGAGLGTFELVVPARYAYVLNALTDPQVHAHNIFLQAGVDCGVLGIVALAWLLLAALVSLARTLRARPGGWQRPVAAGLLG
ncbi:MAG: O-antigen ligase family protein, partial [Chloroflexi bacterium]|nr:O-antigen ligase family protein [Chloroflexota bacterium]